MIACLEKKKSSFCVNVRVFLERLSVCLCSFFRFRFEAGIWDLIVLIPDHCLFIYLVYIIIIGEPEII